MPTTRTSAAGPSALVIDDNPLSATLSRTVVEANGWSVEIAQDGFEAIVSFRARNYDLVLLDYHLPGMDGAQVMAWIRKNLPTPPEVIVVSSESPDFLRSRFSGMGVKAILSKPISPADLYLALQAA